MFEIIIIDDVISLNEIKLIAEKQFGSMVKAVIDIEKNSMAIGGESIEE